MDEKRTIIVNRTIPIILGFVAIWQCFLVYASAQFKNLLMSFEMEMIFVDLLRVLQIAIPVYLLLTLALAVYFWKTNKIKPGEAALIVFIVLIGTLFAHLAVQAAGYIPIFQEGAS